MQKNETTSFKLYTLCSRSLDNDDNQEISPEGSILQVVELNVSKELLDEKNADSLNVTCLFPVWNTTEWISKSSTIYLESWWE